MYFHLGRENDASRSRTLVVGATLFVACSLSVGGARAASCGDSWRSASSGLWGVAANWTNGIPTSSDAVCITLPGTYTVTVAPWSVGTADPNSNGANIGSLTLGRANGAGTQTLDVVGQGSTSNSNEQLSTVFLTVAATSTVAAHGNLILDSTAGGFPRLRATSPARYAAVSGAAILNYGSVEAEAPDQKNANANLTQFEAPLVNEPGARVRDGSGTLEATAVTNGGAFTVAAGAALAVVALQGVYGSWRALRTTGRSSTAARWPSLRRPAPPPGRSRAGRSRATR